MLYSIKGKSEIKRERSQGRGGEERLKGGMIGWTEIIAQNRAVIFQRLEYSDR